MTLGHFSSSGPTTARARPLRSRLALKDRVDRTVCSFGVSVITFAFRATLAPKIADSGRVMDASPSLDLARVHCGQTDRKGRGGRSPRIAPRHFGLR